MKVLIVGAGISGCVAGRILTDHGHEVEIWETRDHIGGNCHDEKVDGVTVHHYGPHLFHTNDKDVWDFLSRFTAWRDYRHTVVADTAMGRISIPYSLKTEQQLGRSLSDEEIRQLIFVEYSEKQWGVPWNQLPETIQSRVPTRRDNADDRYFTDVYQGQPVDGYAAMFARMLEGIPVRLNAEKDAWRARVPQVDKLIYTGKLDEYFGYAHGRLPYRSLRFEHRRSAERLPHPVINQCNHYAHTREYDHAWFSDEQPETTVITREYPVMHDETNEPFYPMPFNDGVALHRLYKALAVEERNTVFLGRLATYGYLDMWMAVAQVMVKVGKLINNPSVTH